MKRTLMESKNLKNAYSEKEGSERTIPKRKI